MSDKRLFKNADEQERKYAPEQVPEERKRAVADEGADQVQQTSPDEPPSAAPVFGTGTAPSAVAAPPEAEFPERDDENRRPEDKRDEPRSR